MTSIFKILNNFKTRRSRSWEYWSWKLEILWRVEDIDIETWRYSEKLRLPLLSSSKTRKRLSPISWSWKKRESEEKENDKISVFRWKSDNKNICWIWSSEIDNRETIQNPDYVCNWNSDFCACFVIVISCENNSEK